MISNFGPYQVTAEIGRGGFGRVFKATDTRLGRAVAIKVLTATGDSDLFRRFGAEARSTARLHHPNIITIYDVGEHEGAPFIVMEHLEGRDLRQVIADPVPVDVTGKIRIMVQVARGLEHAHAQGVIHRDVKPGNIFILPSGDVKVMDFGIARAARAAETRLTRSGDIIGTVLYMAPEQFRSQDADALTDIFAFGATFYELLAGAHPFAAPDVASMMYNVTSLEPEPPSKRVPDCPPALDAIVIRCLAKDRERRYQSFSELLADLEPVLAELQSEKSTQLLGQAKALLEAGESVHAEALAQELLAIEPSNREARMLHSAASEALRRSSIQERIQAARRTAEDLLARGRFDEAVSALESAMALSPGDSLLSDRLAEVRKAVEQRQTQGRRPGTGPPAEGDRTVLVDADTLDRSPPPAATLPEDFTRFFGSAELDAPLNAFVTVLSCPDPYREGQTFPVKTRSFTIGRAESDLCIPEDRTLSREHATLRWKGAGYTIEDAGATNGTYLNGARLEAGRETPLPLNAEIRLSKTTCLRFRCEISELPDFTGQTLANRYRLERRLRATRKSALYEGRDTRPPRKVAIKLLSPNLAAYPGYLEQFEGEAQSAAELDHPNICRIYEHNRAPLQFPPGGERQVHYICMQMLDGGSLVQRLDAPEDCNGEAVAKWLDIVASALEEAHSHGVVHSGLKPTSIVFNAAGTPFVTDFAIATHSGDVGTAGLMFGAPDYLSPEQWDRHAAGPASDQYSLACLCYRMLAGVVPFENQIDHATRDNNLQQGPLPAHIRAKQKGRPPLPEATSAVLAKALSVDPAQRYPSVTDFARAFRQSLGEIPAPARKPAIFVSYRRDADAGWAALFADRLSGLHGLDVFVDRQRVDSARQVPEKIATAIRECDFFVCLLARTTLQSAWVCEEIRIADAAGKPMIPVIHEGFRRPKARKFPGWLQRFLPLADPIPEGARRLLDAEEVRLFADYDQGAIDKLARMILSGSHKPRV